MRCDNSEDREATPRNTVSLSSTNTSEWVKMSSHHNINTHSNSRHDNHHWC
jgi:hypothetical protein